jgi:choloylglycine hydrolase
MSILEWGAGLRFGRLLVLAATVVLAGGGWRCAGGFSDRPFTTGDHCSALSILAEGYPVFGANMDYAYVENGLVFIIPRGLTRTGLWPGVTGENLTWTSRFASLTFSLVGYPHAWAGINEKGLTFSTMNLGYATTYPPPDERPALDSGLWIQYMLDTCETVEDVIAAESRVRIITADHYLVADRHGRRAVLEFLDGQMVVHDDQTKDLWVVTNTTYHWLLQVWERFLQQGYYDSNDSSIRRFLIGAKRVSELGIVNNAEAVQFVFDTLWAMRGEQFSEHISQWSIVFDIRRRKAYFRTASNPEVREVKLFDFSLHCTYGVRMLQIQADLSGDVSGHFRDFSLEESVDQMEEFLTAWGYPNPRSTYVAFTRHFVEVPCSESWRGPAGRRVTP